MEKLIFICSGCEYRKEIFGDLEDFDIIKCELCGNLMDLEVTSIEEEGIITEKELGSIIAVESMKLNLRTFGNNKTWYLLEELFADPKTRLRY